MTNEEVSSALQHLIGKPYTPAVKAYISELTARPRVVGPGDGSTRELDRARIHIVADASGTIEAFNFG
ncbi:I78 family peptidase inhibitor [Pseudomonas sp. P5_152]|uniref:I78 family peptidase inhibitor n=1 Tax=Pseudomonas sp. P5_152 TaxID=3043442 RepID=UPI002A361080|nr:I78 family peptidase inhibitor [Pseudomonas sp. P5_152]MDX9665938.1 I78 family peptidase inhibitor [Pseudomonas sp. P5_152]